MGRVDKDGKEPEDVLTFDLTTRFFCREDGRFRIPVEDPQDWGVLTLRVDAEEHGYLQEETPRFVPTDGHDLGDLVLEPVRALAFTVRDPRGAPIERAFARVEDIGVSRRSAPTGPDGAGRLGFAPDRATRVCVSAPGFTDSELEADPGRVLEVVLEPLAVLDVRIGDSLIGLAERLVLSAERPAFVWDESGWVDGRLAVQAELGSVMPAVRRQPAAPGQRFEYEFQRQHDGHFRLVGLVPDVPLTVEVRDARGSVLAADAVSVAGQATAKLELGGPSTARPEPLRVKVPMRRSATAPR
jgi:hypothetical protein